MSTYDHSELDPVLEGHRARWATLTRWKRITLFVGVIGVTSAVLAAPETAREKTFYIGFGAVAVLFLLIDVARFRIFLRDRKERGA